MEVGKGAEVVGSQYLGNATVATPGDFLSRDERMSQCRDLEAV